MSPLKICFAASEVVPFAKTGGLADVAGALPKYLSHLGHDVRVFMPFYSTVNTAGMEIHPVDFIQNVPVHFGGFTLHFTALTTRLPRSQADIYFIHCEGLYNRGRIYTEDPDEYLRFALFSRAVIECCQRMGWAPDIIHCHDWQTALIPLYCKTVYGWDSLFHASRTVLTIHNIGYQGVFSAEVLSPLGLDAHRDLLPQEDLQGGVINFLKTGILHADMLTTVSETYAREIQTPEYGAGLETLLRLRSDRLVGILNGVDYEEWNPETDPYIPYHYSTQDLSGKEKNKQALLERLNLPYSPETPVVGIISRLTPQKGLDLLQAVLPDFLGQRDMRFVALGSGEDRYVHFFEELQRTFPEKVCFYNGYNMELAHWIEAGADMYVMPSRYEPCGLNQIYSLKYGTVPIVRKTGGLADTVQLYDWQTQTGTGFVFEHFTPEGLRWAMDHAYSTFFHRDAWRKLMRNGMAQDFSWEKQVHKYVALYRGLVSMYS
ncbi:MAG: glycogen synthase GlgA [Calditrichaeota bacterium]|nr:MAG: glycogen synthase GlgA [Calditrichota bacterium]